MKTNQKKTFSVLALSVVLMSTVLMFQNCSDSLPPDGGVTSTSSSSSSSNSIPLTATEPKDQNVAIGASAQLNAVLNDSYSKYSFQWYRGTPTSSTILPGETFPSLVLANLQASDTNTYFVRVTLVGSNTKKDSRQAILNVTTGGTTTTGGPTATPTPVPNPQWRYPTALVIAKQITNGSESDDISNGARVVGAPDNSLAEFPPADSGSRGFYVVLDLGANYLVDQIKLTGRTNTVSGYAPNGNWVSVSISKTPVGGFIPLYQQSGALIPINPITPPGEHAFATPAEGRYIRYETSSNCTGCAAFSLNTHYVDSIMLHTVYSF